MYARVVPLLRLPRSMGVFDYAIPQGLSVFPGSLVRVPFRSSQVFGIVTELRQHTDVPPAKIKPITSCASPYPLISPSLVRTAQYVADDTFTSLGTLYRSIIPSFPKTKTLSFTRLPNEQLAPSKIRIPDIQPAQATSGTLLTYTDDAALISWYRSAAAACENAGRTTLIVCPTIARVNQLVRAFSQAITLHHGMRPTEYRAHFIAIRTAHTSIVVGTRSAIFAPINDLGLILIDNEDHDEHVQDMPNPRYDARRAAVMRAQLTGAVVVLTSRFASIIARERYPIAASIGDPYPVSPEPISLDEHHRSGSYQLITERARMAINDSLARKRPALVVHHRHDLHSALVCPDCGYMPQCATCMVALHHEHNELVCRHCAVRLPIPLTCPRCGSADLRGRGRGIAFVVKELVHAGMQAREWNPGDRIDARTAYVTTAALLSTLPERAFGCVVMTRYDSIRSIPRYDADERARRAVVLLRARAESGGRVLVQATEQQFGAIKTPDDPSWRTATLTERTRFGYPPHWKITLLRRRNDAPGSRRADELYRTLTSLHTSVHLTPPQRSPGRSRRDTGGTIVVIRHTGQLPRSIQSILTTLDDGWSITVNPLDLR